MSANINTFPLIKIDVIEIDAPDGSPIPGGHTDYILLNPDPTNPFIIENPLDPLSYLEDEYHTPRVENPRVENYTLSDESDEDKLNPRVLNPRVENPRVLNPRVLNPRVENLGVENPRVENISFINSEMANPRVENPRVENTALADVIWEVTNDGNTTSAYTLTMLSTVAEYDEEREGYYIPDPEIIAQVLVYRMHTNPVADGCTLLEEHSDELILNITNPRVENPRVWNPRVENLSEGNPRVENPRVENATFALAPGETAYVVFRVWDDNVSGNTAGALSASTGPLSTNTVNPGWLSIEKIIGTETDPTIGAALSAHAPDTGEDEPTVVISENAAPFKISGTVKVGANPIQGVTITFSHNAHTEITNASGYYEYMVNYGTTTTLTASHPGYSGWTPITLTNIVNDQPGQDFVDAVINTYTISVTAGSGGSIAPSDDVTVNHGADLTFTITAADRFEISDVLVDGASQGAISTYTFIDIQGNHTIVALFSAVDSGLVMNDLNSQTATDLANLLLGEGVTISNAVYSGALIAAGTFTGGTGIIGFESGIILSSGDIADVVGPNLSDSTSTDNGTLGDTDLESLIPAGQTTFDAAVLEFDFKPSISGVVTFQYVFTSEEYNEYANSQFNNVFGFFIGPVNDALANYALLPDGVTPVSINNVNGGNPLGTNAQNSKFYINNDCSDPDGGTPCTIDIEADGLTVVLILTASVNANQEYHIKLAIADAGDSVLDSWVFIKAASFKIE